MFTHLHENNKQKLNFNNSFERLKHSLFFLYKFFIQVFAVFAFSIAQAQTVENTFNKKLENTIEKVASKVMDNEKKIVITVVDIFNAETLKRDSMTEELEEKLTDMLFKKLPVQVIPHFENVYLRLEWKSTFPEMLEEPPTLDLAKLTNADWLLTGTYHTTQRLLSLRLNLYEIYSGDLIWQAVVESERETATESPTIQTEVARHHDFEKVIQELLTETPAIQTEVARHHDFEKDVVEEFEAVEEFKSEFFPEMSAVQTEKEAPQIPEGMVKIPEGEFLMGSYSGEEDELPDHLVYIKSFYLDAHEVTNEAYSRCPECERGSGGFDTFDRQQPVVYVDWKNAESYCNSQNKRLPTEAEWEYAARAGSHDKYSFGNNTSLLENYAWLKSNTVDKGLWGARKVSGKLPNRWGVHDLYGNVMEWVQNYYTPDYFHYIREPDLHNGLNSPADKEYPLRVVRGGAWGGLHDAGTPEGVRSAKRYAFTEWTRSFQIGFRCAMDIPE